MEEKELGAPHNEEKVLEDLEEEKAKCSGFRPKVCFQNYNQVNQQVKAAGLQLAAPSQHSRWPPLFSDSGTSLVQALHVHFILDEFWDFVCGV